MQFRTIYAYRSDFLFNVVVLLLQVFLLRVVWTSVYGEQTSARASGGVGSIELSVQIAYATLALVQFWLFNPWANHLAQRVYEGKVAIDLARPVGLVQQTIASQVGGTVALLPFALGALPFAVLIGGAAAPASVGAAMGYLLATIGAYAITVLLNTLVGMMAFWTLEVQGASFVYRLVAQLFSGALVPLWFMPEWMRAVAQAMPFQATTYTPVAIYLGRVADVPLAIAVQVLWIVLLWFGLRLVWARALHRVVVQGG